MRISVKPEMCAVSAKARLLETPQIHYTSSADSAELDERIVQLTRQEQKLLRSRHCSNLAAASVSTLQSLVGSLDRFQANDRPRKLADNAVVSRWRFVTMNHSFWNGTSMTPIKMIFSVACLSLIFVGTASAQPGWGYRHHHRPYYGYGYGYGPAYPYPPVVVAPPPVVIASPPTVVPAPAPAPVPGVVSGPIYSTPAYTTPTYPTPTYVAPAPVLTPVPAPVYVPPAYGYGVVGPRRHYGFGYNSPGIGVYIGR